MTPGRAVRWAAPILGGVLAGCQVRPDAAPAPAEAPAPREEFGFDYAAWPAATEQPYPVVPAFLVLCRPPTAEQIRQQEAEERGPHAGSAVVVRVNPPGLDAFRAGGAVPVGTVVIKEKFPHYAPGVPPVAVAAMIKREAGYDPDHGDWEYAYEDRGPDREAKAVRGRLASCIDCHQRASRTDFLFRPYLRVAR